MGYRTKIQKVERPTNQSFYVNLPSAVAQAMDIEKGEEFDWIIEDKHSNIFNYDNAEVFIDKIGEPLIAEKLRQMYQEKISKSKTNKKMLNDTIETE